MYAAKDIPRGTVLEREMLMIVRPSPDGFMPPKKLDAIIGRATKVDLKRGDLVTDGVVDT